MNKINCKETYQGWTLLPSKFEGFEKGANPLGILRELDLKEIPFIICPQDSSPEHTG